MNKIYLLLLLLTGYGLQAQNPQPQNRVGYASLDYIISQLPETKELESQLQASQSQLRSQIQEKSQAVQKQYSDFNQNANTMVDTVRARKQQDLEQAISDLEQMQQDAQNTLQNQRKLFMAPIYLKVNRAIADVAKENGFEIILTDRISNYDFLLFHQEQMDISNLVLQKFGITPTPK